MRGVGSLSCTPFIFLYHHNLCNCRSSSSDYIIPFGKFAKSLGNPLSIGMRFKMRYESEDSAERRLVHSIFALNFLVTNNIILSVGTIVVFCNLVCT